MTGTLAIAGERITIGAAVGVLGVPERTVRDLALRGEIPGAAKIGGRWTFDLARLREYFRRQEAATCQSARPQRARSGASRSQAPIPAASLASPKT
jgi:Helix-turn-helix domain